MPEAQPQLTDLEKQNLHYTTMFLSVHAVVTAGKDLISGAVKTPYKSSRMIVYRDRLEDLKSALDMAEMTLAENPVPEYLGKDYADFVRVMHGLETFTTVEREALIMVLQETLDKFGTSDQTLHLETALSKLHQWDNEHGTQTRRDDTGTTGQSPAQEELSLGEGEPVVLGGSSGDAVSPESGQSDRATADPVS